MQYIRIGVLEAQNPDAGASAPRVLTAEEKAAAQAGIAALRAELAEQEALRASMTPEERRDYDFRLTTRTLQVNRANTSDNLPDSMKYERPESLKQADDVMRVVGNVTLYGFGALAAWGIYYSWKNRYRWE